MTKYYALLTTLGAAKLANAAALGTKLQITHMAVGDGGGTLPTPNASQTALVAEKRRAALNALSIDTANSSQIIAEQVIPEGDGGFWIREIGLFDADGVMIAVANCPETYKPQLQEGSGRTQTVRMILIVNSTEAVTLKIDPSVVLATRKYVDDRVIEVKAWADSLMAQHLAAADPHPQYAQKASPVLTGKPTAPTPAKTDNSTQVATTAYVRTALASLVDSSPESLDTLKELAEALGNDPSFAATVMNMLAGKLTKDQNGADIPDPAFFRENIGIKSAALRAVTTTDNPDPDEVIDIKAGDARYLWKQANGSDIPDKKTFRENLELGSSSISNTGSDSGNVPTIAIADARYLTQSTTNVSGYSIFRTPLENGKVLIRQSGFINLKSGLQNIINLPVSLSEIITAAHISIVDADPGPDRPIGISPQSLSVFYVRNWGSNNVMARWTVEGI